MIATKTVFELKGSDIMESDIKIIKNKGTIAFLFHYIKLNRNLHPWYHGGDIDNYPEESMKLTLKSFELRPTISTMLQNIQLDKQADKIANYRSKI